MGNAKKCDRCGTLYESPICNDVVQITVDYGYAGGECKFDLCDKCYEELVKWTDIKNVSTKRTKL